MSQKRQSEFVDRTVKSYNRKALVRTHTAALKMTPKPRHLYVGGDIYDYYLFLNDIEKYAAIESSVRAKKTKFCCLNTAQAIINQCVTRDARNVKTGFRKQIQVAVIKKSLWLIDMRFWELLIDILFY